MNKIKEATKELIEESGINTLPSIYNEIIESINYYLDVSEESSKLIALWILGSHFHKLFPTYPILYLNAMRGSGKTRTLNLISHLSLGLTGNVLNSISESALFHSQGVSLCIDEFEPSATEKNKLNLLLNSCYKRGAKVPRMVKTKNKKTGKEGYEKEEHSLYMPVAIANINGLDSVLENRALILFLERSFNKAITSRIENFDNRLKGLKASLRSIGDGLDKKSDGDSKTTRENDGMTAMTQVLDGWNEFIDSQNLNISNTSVIPVTASSPSSASLRHYEVYRKIYEKGITGRTLELCFPLLTVASLISEEIFEQALQIFSTISKRRRESELDELHVLIYRFVSTVNINIEDYYNATELLNRFKEFCSFDLEMKPTAFSHALERLQLIKERKRTSQARLLKLDIEKAKKKIGLFDRESSP